MMDSSSRPTRDAGSVRRSPRVGSIPATALVVSTEGLHARGG